MLELSRATSPKSIPHECNKLGDKEVLENPSTQDFGDILLLSIHPSMFQPLVPLNWDHRNENVFATTQSSSLPPLGDQLGLLDVA
jgi:hypothetical protein